MSKLISIEGELSNHLKNTDHDGFRFQKSFNKNLTAQVYFLIQAREINRDIQSLDKEVDLIVSETNQAANNENSKIAMVLTEYFDILS